MPGCGPGCFAISSGLQRRRSMEMPRRPSAAVEILTLCWPAENEMFIEPCTAPAIERLILPGYARPVIFPVALNVRSSHAPCRRPLLSVTFARNSIRLSVAAQRIARPNSDPPLRTR